MSIVNDDYPIGVFKVMQEEIDELQIENERLREVLEQIKNHDTHTLYGDGNAKQMALIAEEGLREEP